MPKDSFTAALARLDPASRALLDLSLRREMRPEEIGDLLGTDPESVIVAREAALEQLARELGVEDAPDLDDLRIRLGTLPSEAWTPRAEEEPGEDEPAGEEEPAEEERPQLHVVSEEPEAVEAAPAEPKEPKERKSRLPFLLTLLAVAAIVLVVVLASSGGDDENSASSPGPPAQPSGDAKPGKKPSKKPAEAGNDVALAPVGAAGDAKGTASLVDGGKRLRLDVTGLPSAAYEVWLYDSVIEATLIGKASGTKIELDAKLPADASKYTYVDVSREPADGNPNHSGESVLRVPLAKLSR